MGGQAQTCDGVQHLQQQRLAAFRRLPHQLQHGFRTGAQHPGQAGRVPVQRRPGFRLRLRTCTHMLCGAGTSTFSRAQSYSHHFALARGTAEGQHLDHQHDNSTSCIMITSTVRLSRTSQQEACHWKESGMIASSQAAT